MAQSSSKAPLKGLILSGGKGTRLRPFTYTGAKQLVPIANKPILFYAIEELVDSGITDLGIVVGDTKEEVVRAVGDGSRFGAHTTYIDQSAPLGIAHAVKISQQFLGDSPFVLFLGDNFIRGGIAEYVEKFRTSCHNSLILLCPVEEPQHVGIAELDGERLVRVVEKPQEPPSDLAIIGIYLFDGHVFDAIGRIRPSARGELEITDTIQQLIDDGLDVRAEKITGRWIDTGKHDDLLEANHVILEDLQPANLGKADGSSTLTGPVVLEEGAEVVNSRVKGPAIIGERTRVVDSDIGPYTSIYHDCLITGSEISESVVLEHTRIEHAGSRIENSLIGRNVELQGDGQESVTFILGDHSKVRMP